MVFDLVSNTKCEECGEELLRGSFLFKQGEKGLCLECADLDHLVYLGRVAAQLRAEELDQTYVRQFAAAIRTRYPGCPAGSETKIAEHACRKYSRRVGRSAAAKDFDDKAVELAVRAHVRHVHTKYDEYLMVGFDREAARHAMLRVGIHIKASAKTRFKLPEDRKRGETPCIEKRGSLIGGREGNPGSGDTMQYRPLGRTGIQVSEIGLGGHREGMEHLDGLARTARFFRTAQERARIVARAIDLGVNYFDTTFGCEIESLGESLRLAGRRDGLFVSGMRVDFFANMKMLGRDPREFTRHEVERTLREARLEMIDQFMFGALDGGDPLSHPRALMDDALAEALNLRDQGKIRCIGFSCHSPDYAARLIEAFPVFDSAMVPYNFANRAAEGALASVAAAQGTALVGMKPLVWHAYGLPVTGLRSLRPVSDRLEFDPSAPIAQLALRWILRQPLFRTCVPAANSIAAVEENASASGAGVLDARELEHLEAYAKAMTAEDMIPLFASGLLTDNMRVRACAMENLRQRMKWSDGELNVAAEDAEQTAAEISEEFLKRLRQDPRISAMLP